MIELSSIRSSGNDLERDEVAPGKRRQSNSTQPPRGGAGVAAALSLGLPNLAGAEQPGAGPGPQDGQGEGGLIPPDRRGLQLYSVRDASTTPIPTGSPSSSTRTGPVARSIYDTYTAPDGTTRHAEFDPIATALKYIDRCAVFHTKDGVVSATPPKASKATTPGRPSVQATCRSKSSSAPCSRSGAGVASPERGVSRRSAPADWPPRR